MHGLGGRRVAASFGIMRSTEAPRDELVRFLAGGIARLPYSVPLTESLVVERLLSKKVFAQGVSLVATDGGKSYTLSETKEILGRAGFADFEVVDIALASRLLIARKV